MCVLIPEGVGGCVDTRGRGWVCRYQRAWVCVLIPESVGGGVDTRGRGWVG